MTAMFAHDQTTLFYPCSPGIVYAITLADLAETTAGDSDPDFASVSDTVDLADMLVTSVTMGDSEVDQQRMLYPIDVRPSVAPAAFVLARTGIVAVGAGDIAEDFADVVEAWADWCDEQVAAEESARLQPAAIRDALAAAE